MPRTLVSMICLSVSWLACQPLAAQTRFTDLYVFGDSLSDVGNISDRTLGLQPGPYYYSGRISNGPVYAEHLASGLGLATLLPSELGGNNFAFGGAQSSGTTGLVGLFVDDLDEQVDAFLARDLAPSPSALGVVWAGAGDFLNGETDAAAAAARVGGQLQRLAAHGLSHLLVINLPPLGETPRYRQSTAMSAEMNRLTAEFNITLWSYVDTLETSFPDVRLHRLDTESLFLEMLSDPSAFGLSNVTDAAAPGLSPGAATYDIGAIVARPEAYLFWDDIHPTAAAHRLFGQRAAQLLVAEPAGSSGSLWIVWGVIVLRRGR